jgi:hypothetical protein
MNPFSFGNPIKDPEKFYGRKSEIRQITNRLLSSAHESTSIVGERRIGKTSLLNYLAHPLVAPGLGLMPDKYCMIYLDFQGLTDITPLRFWQRVLSRLSKSICDESLQPEINRLSQQTSIDLFDLEDLFQSANDKGLTIVLLMDEFEYITQNPNFKSDFFGGLRALAIHHGVALLPATRRELVDLCHSDEIKGSPFFNIFANVILRPFSRSETAEMIIGYTSGYELALTPAEFDVVQSLGGGYPFFVQTVGYYMVDGKAQGFGGNGLLTYVNSNFCEQSDAHFSYMWSHSNESERITLLGLMSLNTSTKTTVALPTLENLTSVHPRAAQDLVNLIKRGMVLENGGLYSLFSPFLGQWIKREMLNSGEEKEDELSARKWVEDTGKTQAKEASGALLKFKKRYWPILSEFLEEFAMKFAVSGAIDLVKGLM